MFGKRGELQSIGMQHFFMCVTVCKALDCVDVECSGTKVSHTVDVRQGWETMMDVEEGNRKMW